MRASLLWLALLVCLPAAADEAPLNITALAEMMPTCALVCVGNALSQSPACTVANLQCLCSNVTLQYEMSTCMQDTCTIAQLLPMAAASNQLCAGVPYESRGRDLTIINIVLASLALPAIALRCCSRYLIAKELWWDDWTIIVAGLAFVGILVGQFLDIHYGFGIHVWNLLTENYSRLLWIFLSIEVMYVLVVVFTKVSILLFYLRIFRRPFFQTFVTWTIVFTLVGGSICVLVLILQCNPVYGYWERNIPSTCINSLAFSFAASTVSVAQDLVILVLPIPELATLQMSRRKKWNVMGMFGIGGFACITSIIRLKYMVTFGGTRDPSWDNVTPTIWSMIELCVTIICACLPAIRALAIYLLPASCGVSDSCSNEDHDGDPAMGQAPSLPPLNLKSSCSSDHSNMTATVTAAAGGYLRDEEANAVAAVCRFPSCRRPHQQYDPHILVNTTITVRVQDKEKEKEKEKGNAGSMIESRSRSRSSLERPSGWDSSSDQLRLVEIKAPVTLRHVHNPC